MPSRMIATVIALVAMLTACSSAAPAGSTPTAAAPSSSASGTPAAVTAAPPTVGPVAGELDACALITVAEAAAATGVAVTRADGAGGACQYYGEADALVIGLGTETDTFGLAALNTYLDDPANELVQGIGDKAVIFQAGGGDYAGRAIYVRKGSRGFHMDVLVRNIDTAAARAALIQLATIVAGRI